MSVRQEVKPTISLIAKRHLIRFFQEIQPWATVALSVEIGGSMRVRFLMIASAAIAMSLAASAQAAMSTQDESGDVSLSLSSFFAPTQFGEDGSVYGVRARASSMVPTKTCP